MSSLPQRSAVPKRVDIWHSILWSKYKGATFTELHRLSDESELSFRIIQIAETRSQRIDTPVDLSYHDYPYEVVFPGSYDAVPRLRLYARLFSLVMRSDADLVLLGGYGRSEHWAQAVAALLSGKRLGVFCDSTLNDHRQGGVKSLLKRLFLSRCEVVFGYGERSAELARYYGVPESRIVRPLATAALPRSYDVSVIPELRKARRAAEPQFLYVGRMAKEKGLDLLLKAFANVAAGRRGASLLLVGDGPQRPALQALARSLGLEEAVTFVGSRVEEDLSGSYLEASCLVLPSSSEPWGLVVNEALSYGCPVVVSERCGCVPELVAEGETGLTFRTGDPTDLAEKMNLALERFVDVEQTAKRCVEQAAPFTPRRSAEQIYAGCKAVLVARSGPDD
jgi:glycosyltransferase involved in cell wall biosynthesis